MADEELISEYKLTLSELVNNAKITINVLSMLADENKKFAPQIAETIEDRIRTAIPIQKLPTLYLIDSIIKNVKDSDYLQIFGKNIVSLFICVFERGDEKIRSSMYKLRQTWVELFPNDILLKLDLAVNSIDPAWPITAARPIVGQQTVHLNPDFLNKAKEALKGLTSGNSLKIVRPSDAEKLEEDRKEDMILVGPEACQDSLPTTSGSGTAGSDSEAEMLLQQQLMAKQLLAKQQELLQIQQRRVEIELAKAQMQIEQAKQLALQKPKQTQEVTAPTTDPSEDKSPKKSKVKRNRTSSRGEDDAEGLKVDEKLPEEQSMTSPHKNKSTTKANEPVLTEIKVDPLKTILSNEESANDSVGASPEKSLTKKRKSGDSQKVDPRLRKKMMLNRDGTGSANVQAEVQSVKRDTEKIKVSKDVVNRVTKEESSKIAKEATLSEDLKDLFGNEDKDFRKQVQPLPKVSFDTHWKVLKSEGQNVPPFNFAQHKVMGGERRAGINNRFGPYGKYLGGMNGTRKPLLPTPPIFGQELKPRQMSIDNFEKLQEIKKELDVEAERLNSLSYDASVNGDFEAFEKDVMRGNSLLNKAKWNNWRPQDRGAKRPRRQVGDQFHNGPPFGNRPPPRSLLHAPPRVPNFSELQSHQPSPPHQQYCHQPSPPQFNQQPHSPGQNNFGHGHDDYIGDDYNFNHYGNDRGPRHNRDLHYCDENNGSPGDGSWGGYHPSNPPIRQANHMDWRGPRPQQSFPQASMNSTTSVSMGPLAPSFQGPRNNFNHHHNNNNQAKPTGPGSEQQYVNQLFSQLTKFGILNNFMPGNSKEQEVVKLSDFDVKKMKIKYKFLIEDLHTGILCKTCGLTFPPTKGLDVKKGEIQAKERYLMHLDWHYQVNKKANSIPKAERCREYYPDLDTWYRHEVVNITRIPIEDSNNPDSKIDDGGVSSTKPKGLDAVEDKLESMKHKYKDDLITFVYKSKVNDNEKCFICNEGFESYWDDEREEWGLKDSYKLKDKLFHTTCFLEYEEHDISFVEKQPTIRCGSPGDLSTSPSVGVEDSQGQSETCQVNTDTSTTTHSEVNAIELTTEQNVDIKTFSEPIV